MAKNLVVILGPTASGKTEAGGKTCGGFTRRNNLCGLQASLSRHGYRYRQGFKSVYY